MEEAVTPLPRPETTPPETTTYFMTNDERARVSRRGGGRSIERAGGGEAFVCVCDGYGIGHSVRRGERRGCV